MSEITNIIDRIAILAEQSGYVVGCLEYWSVCGGYNPDYPPRLNRTQMQELTQNYPFHLPSELYELYQRGNGCLPIGLDLNKNWDSFNSYFQFELLFSDNVFLPFAQAINYDSPSSFWWKKNKGILEYTPSARKTLEEKLTCSLDWEDIGSRVFPVSIAEKGLYFVLGSERQQETSPVLFLYADLVVSIKWSSLTRMLFAVAEVMEREIQAPRPSEDELLAIWRSYMEEV